jgi:dTDP-4-amino-4,6-dideoxygalactose transaminase
MVTTKLYRFNIDSKVSETMRSNLTETLEYFEERLAQFIGVKHTIVTGSGRAALEFTLKSLGLEETSLLCSCYTCSIVPQTILKAGAYPCFVDIRENLSLDIDNIPENLSQRCSAILMNYLYGCPTDFIEEIFDFAQQNELIIIEDVAQSFGAEIGNRKAGSIGDAGIFSFPKVFFPLFRGGCIATNRDDVAEKARLLRAKLQISPKKISMIQTNLKRRGSSISNVFRPIKSSKYFSPPQSKERGNNIYYYFDPTHPYHYWNLTENELEMGISTLESFAYLKKIRSNLVKDILIQIEEKWNGILTPVFPYREEYVYSKIPVLMNRIQCEKIKSFLQSNRIILNMNYRSLCNNSLFSGKSSICSPCVTSSYLSQYMIPLPVEAQMTQIFKNVSLEENHNDEKL